MSRLPIPGSDNDIWGDILNDFLGQTHASNGALKSNVVGSTQIAPGAVTSTQLADDAVDTDSVQAGAITNVKIADATITAAKLAPGVLPGGGGAGTDKLRSLLIFYSPPNIMNGRFSDDYAAGVMSRYDDIVLGSGLQDSGHLYHASTVSIIQKTNALAPDTVMWGYIDLGVTTSNLSLPTLQGQIDQWVAMGVTGIFCDLVGYEYQVSRARQNSIINYIHGKSLPAFLNVWDSDDLLAPTVNPTYNPSGTPTAATSIDAMLLESWICNSDAYTAPFYDTFGNIKVRGDKAVAYRSSMGIRLFATNIYSHSNHTGPELKAYYDYTEAFARVWRLNGSGLAASNYASSGVDIGIVTPRYSSFHATPLRPTAGYSLNGPWTEISAPDLGIAVTYDTGTSTYTALEQ